MKSVTLSGLRFWVCMTVVTVAAVGASAETPRRLTLDERVNYQRKIEEVYWRHRIWPKENPTAKPSLSQVMPDAVIRARVKDALKKSNALDNFRQRPITAEQLQAEMERMARDTRDGATLQELFRALGDDPQVIAETLARQSLVDREIPDLFPNDLADGSWSDIAQPAGFFTLPSVALTACRTDTWTPTSPSGITERYGHTSVWTGTELIVWGGYYAPSPSYLNTGGRYNPSTDSWTPTSIGSGVPGARFSHTAVWTGTEMIVWGGNIGLGLTNDTHSYTLGRALHLYQRP